MLFWTRVQTLHLHTPPRLNRGFEYTMPRSIETVVGYYDKFTNDSRDVAYAVVLLKRADELLRNAEESGQIPTDLRNPAAVA